MTVSLACGQDSGQDDAPCLDQAQAAACTPQYEPTFDNVYQNTILTRCATGGGSCHLAGAAKGGLVLEGIDAAYDGLVTAGRVVAGDPECSLVIRRLEATRDRGMMPPGTPLTEPERCAVTLWVRQGAER